MKGRELLVDSTNSELLDDSSNAPLKDIVSKTDSILYESPHDLNFELPSLHQASPQTTSNRLISAGKVPLVLEKRKEGIAEDNMVVKEVGMEKWRVGKMIGGGGSGRVYRTLNIQTGCLYAVKKVHLC